MSTADARRVGAVASALVPPLTDRLARHQLAEIEVQQGEVRVRVSRGATADRRPSAHAPAAPASALATRAASDSGPGVDGNVLRSPAVGYFLAAEGLAEGMTLAPGTEVGEVEMLGVRHGVRATESGVVRRVTVETGQAVEYGQALVEIGPAPS